MRRFLAFALLIAPAAIAQTDTGWRTAGNGPDNLRANNADTVINPMNVSGLVPKWTLALDGNVWATPTVEGRAVYAVDLNGGIWRIDAETGRPVWHFKLSAISGNSNSASRTSPAIGPTQIVIGDQASATVYSLDKTSGRLIWRTRLDHAIGSFITTAAVISGGRVVVGVASMQEELAATVKGYVPDFRGSVAALDLATGHVQWQFHTVPEGFTGGAVWGSNLAVDPARHAVYADTGDNYSVPAAVASCQAEAGHGKPLARCLPASDHIDSVLALDLATGQPIWTRRMTDLDTWTVSCLPSQVRPGSPCPQPSGLDYDFGSAPNLFTRPGDGRALVGAGQKSGVYWALDRDTGATVWATQVDPGGSRGGIEWGVAVGGERIFVPASNSTYTWAALKGHTQLTNGGYWTALDAATGQILWQTPTEAKQPKPASHSGRTILPPAGAFARTEGAVSVSDGVMYGSDEAGNFVGLDALTGKRLWHFRSPAAAIDAPAIVGGRLYWGDGYGDIGLNSNKLYAFGLK